MQNAAVAHIWLCKKEAERKFKVKVWFFVFLSQRKDEFERADAARCLVSVSGISVFSFYCSLLLVSAGWTDGQWCVQSPEEIEVMPHYKKYLNAS